MTQTELDEIIMNTYTRKTTVTVSDSEKIKNFTSFCSNNADTRT